MKKRLLLLILFCASASTAQNFVTITAQTVYNGGPQLLDSGTILFQAVDNNGNPIGYQVGGGGQQITYPSICSIANGAIQSGCLVANTAATNPLNVCMSVTIKNSFNQVVLGGPNSGYQCVQPVVNSSGTPWCVGGACNFDMYIPNVNGVPVARVAPPTALSLGGILAGDCPTLTPVVAGYGTNGKADCIPGGSSGSSVWGFITGNITTQVDLSTALGLKSPLDSPVLTGIPLAPTPATGDSSTKIATTAFVKTQGYAPTDSPAFSGVPTVPTQSLADNTSEAVNSSWVKSQAYAGLNSPAFTGTPTAPTQGLSDNTTKIATDAFVLGQGYAPLNSPGFTGTPTAPTPITADSSTKLATTAWVNAQGYGVGTGNVSGPGTSTNQAVALFNGTNGHLLADSAITFPLDKSHIGTLASGSNGLAASATLDATNASNITSGTLPSARLPASGVTPASYTNSTVTVDATGRVTAASSGVLGGTSGQLLYNNAGTTGGVTASGDGTFNTSTGVLTITKTNGVVFAPSATLDATNASNITSGTLGALRLPNTSVTPGTYTVSTITIDAAGRITSASNGTAGGGNVVGPLSSTVNHIALFNNGSGTALIDGGLVAASATIDATNATNITSGTLAKARLLASTVFTDQANTFGAFIQTFKTGANLVLTDPVDVTKSLKFDLSNISTSTQRTVNIPNANSTTSQALNAVSHQWINSMSAQGVFSGSQPACGDLSNGAASCSTDTTNAANIGSGTLPAARLPLPTATTLGGVQSLAPASNQFVTGINTSDGSVAHAQPSCGNLSNGAASCSTDTTNATNISSGTLNLARLSTQGGGSSLLTYGSGAANNAPICFDSFGKAIGCTAIVSAATLAFSYGDNSPGASITDTGTGINDGNYDFNVDTGGSSRRNSFRVGMNGIDQIKVCWATGPQAQFVFGTGYDCGVGGVNVNTNPGKFAKEFGISRTGFHVVSRLYQEGFFTGTTWAAVLQLVHHVAWGGISTFQPHAANQGTAYHVGDIVTVTQGGASGGTLTVSTIGGSGNVTALTLTTNGANYTIANGLATTGGLGTGLQVDLLSVANPNFIEACGGSNGTFNGQKDGNCGTAPIIPFLREDGLSTTTIFNATTGFQLNGAAPFGHCLIGNGTVYVDGGCGTGLTSLTINNPLVASGATSATTLPVAYSNLSSTCNGSQTWNLTSAWVASADVTLTGTCTIALSAALDGGNYILLVHQDATGGRALSLSTTGSCSGGWKISNGGAGVVVPTPTANAVDMLAITFHGTGSVCYATYTHNFS